MGCMSGPRNLFSRQSRVSAGATTNPWQAGQGEGGQRGGESAARQSKAGDLQAVGLQAHRWTQPELQSCCGSVHVKSSSDQPAGPRYSANLPRRSIVR